MSARPVETVPRLALNLEEAAASIGKSLPTFRRHVLPTLRVVRLGSAPVVPVDELQRWLTEHQEEPAR